MARRPREDAEEVEVRSRAELGAWLAAHHGRATGVWLVYHKKASPHHLPVREVVAECLAWGWVDSLPRRRDDMTTMLWIAPRKPGSNWSRVNRDLVAALVSEGRLMPPGRAAVDRAIADGTWTALDAVEALEVPPDLAAALDALPPARALWDRFPPSARRGILEWILSAKTAPTRAARIAETARAAAENRRANS